MPKLGLISGADKAGSGLEHQSMAQLHASTFITVSIKGQCQRGKLAIQVTAALGLEQG
jgi:hypothetical protein